MVRASSPLKLASPVYSTPLASSALISSRLPSTINVSEPSPVTVNPNAAQSKLTGTLKVPSPTFRVTVISLPTVSLTSTSTTFKLVINSGTSSSAVKSLGRTLTGASFSASTSIWIVLSIAMLSSATTPLSTARISTLILPSQFALFASPGWKINLSISEDSTVTTHIPPPMLVTLPATPSGRAIELESGTLLKVICKPSGPFSVTFVAEPL